MEEMISIESLERTAKSFERRATNKRMIRVPSKLYNSHPESYTPQFVTIGPFHCINQETKNNSNLLFMEGQKRNFVLNLLERTISKEETLQSCWDFLLLETPLSIRNCYPEETGITLDNEALAKIMLIDGCFLLEVLLYDYEKYSFVIEDHEINLMSPMMLGLRRDLVLLENQIPFFVLEKLYKIISPRLRSSTNCDEFQPPDLTQMVIHFFQLPKQESLYGNLHFLDLIIQCHLPNAQRLDFLTNNCYQDTSNNKSINTRKKSSKHPLSRGVILSTASKLKEAGIIFKRANTSAIIDIRFKNGVLEIPAFVINDCMESKLRNLLAFEHVSKHGMEYYISYVIFMDRLIGGKKDLELLESKGIIVNELGGREDATKLFHHCSKHFVLKNFYFRHLCREIQKFCKSPRQRYKQEFKQKYFNSPWAALSLVAATILLVLTTIQTMYSVLSYYH